MRAASTCRIPRVVALLVAVVLSVGACGSPWARSSNASNTTSSTATDDAAGGSPSQPVAQSTPAGQGVAPGGTTPAANGPAGLSGTTTGGMPPGPSSQGGQSGEAPAASAATSGMSPDDVAQYCKLSGEFSAPGDPEELSAFYFGEAAKPLVELKKHTPVQLQPDVELLYSDYEALANQSRVFPQVKDEVDASYKRVMDFHNQICLAN
jgi:hypothetical protein